MIWLDTGTTPLLSIFTPLICEPTHYVISPLQ